MVSALFPLFAHRKFRATPLESIACALFAKTMGRVYPIRSAFLATRLPRTARGHSPLFLSVLYFHQLPNPSLTPIDRQAPSSQHLTNPFFRNSRVFKSLQNGGVSRPRSIVPGRPGARVPWTFLAGSSNVRTFQRLPAEAGSDNHFRRTAMRDICSRSG